LPIKLTRPQLIQRAGMLLFKNDWIGGLTPHERARMQQYPVDGPWPEDPKARAEVVAARDRHGLMSWQHGRAHALVTEYYIRTECDLERIMAGGFPRQHADEAVSQPSLPRAAGLARYANPPEPDIQPVAEHAVAAAPPEDVAEDGDAVRCGKQSEATDAAPKTRKVIGLCELVEFFKLYGQRPEGDLLKAAEAQFPNHNIPRDSRLREAIKTAFPGAPRPKGGRPKNLAE
jgi:hypothetical protein